jgi:aryl-alcohol dehydrogenase-like predicted oxidoreductase
MINPIEKRTLGKTGINVSSIGFGCWGIADGWGSDFSKKEIARVLDSAWWNGINVFDTAAVYGDGRGELILANRPWRRDAIIASKVSSIQKPSQPIKPIAEYYPKELIVKQVENSLNRLNRDHIDILQLHKWYTQWETEGNSPKKLYHLKVCLL